MTDVTPKPTASSSRSTPTEHHRKSSPEVSGESSPLRRATFWSLMVMAILYMPLAVNYMWFTFSSEPSNWQDSLTAVINGGDYAYREGSVRDVREVDYTNYRWVMLVHTVLGGLALFLMVHQLSPRLRRQSRQRHKVVGWVCMVLMTISMVTALAFLILAGTVDHLGGGAFYLQLWVLGVGTLGSAYLAIIAIRRKNLIAHQAWMYMNFALMMTAPLLRVFWIFLAPLFPDYQLLYNLNLGACMLGVMAPAGAALAMQLTLKARRGAGRGAKSAGTLQYVVASIIFVLSAIVLTYRYQQVSDVIPMASLYLPLAAMVFYFATCVLSALSNRTRGDALGETRWRWLAWGGAFIPGAVITTSILTGVIWSAPEGIIAGLMVGSPGPVTVSFMLTLWLISAKPVAKKVQASAQAA